VRSALVEIICLRKFWLAENTFVVLVGVDCQGRGRRVYHKFVDDMFLIFVLHIVLLSHGSPLIHYIYPALEDFICSLLGFVCLFFCSSSFFAFFMFASSTRLSFISSAFA